MKKKAEAKAEVNYDQIFTIFEITAEQVCGLKLDCGHRCLGTASSDACLPCLEPDCSSEKVCKLTNKDELCSICFTSALSEEPCQRLECGHIFHANCVSDLLKHGWSSLKISFAYLSCPSCKTPITEIDNCLIQ